jgi:hypothetical protein
MSHKRSINESANNESKMYVEVKFPTTGIFECYTSIEEVIIKSRFEKILNETFNLLKKDASLSPTVESGVLEAVIAEITKAKGCCIPENKQKLRSDYCPTCPDNYDEFSFLLKSNGFEEVIIQNPVFSNFIDTTGSIKHFDKIDGFLDGNPIDVNEDVGGYLSKMSAKMEGVFGNIIHYDLSDPDCKSILEMLGIGTQEDIAAKGKLEGKRINGVDLTYKINVVSFSRSDIEASIFIKVDMPEGTGER